MPGVHKETEFDLAIVGGGINGVGIARDAVGRGLSVFLCEQNDLASATSSASTKLIHGGLRYLEFYEFRLVRESLIERETLYRMAPHLIHPLRFVLPHHKALRPWWFLRLGLFFYDHLGGRELLPGTRDIDLRKDPLGAPLKPMFSRGFEYSDCWVDDARLVVLNAVDARDKGARIETYRRCVSAERHDGGWELTVAPTAGGAAETVSARVLINATGPWASSFASHVGKGAAGRTRLVKGSHIVVPRLYDHAQPYIFQNPDGRIIFAIPYERDFTMIGTTDVDYEGDPGDAAIDAGEVEYLCREAGAYLEKSITPADVVHSFSGVRPLYDDGKSTAQQATRDYVFELDRDGDGAPVLHVFGGKLTTYRRLAERALEKVAPFFPDMGRPWTAGAALPGGDFEVGGRGRLANELREAHPCIEPEIAARWVAAYGTRAAALADGTTDIGDLGRHFGAGLYEREVSYLMETEFAATPEDILWRRSKLGLRITESETDGLAEWFDRMPADAVLTEMV